MEEIVKRYPASIATITFSENAMPVFHAVSGIAFTASLHIDDTSIGAEIKRGNDYYCTRIGYQQESIISMWINNTYFDIGAFSDKYAPINIISKEPIEAIVHMMDGRVETKKCIRMPGGYRLVFVALKNAIVRIVGVGNE